MTANTHHQGGGAPLRPSRTAEAGDRRPEIDSRRLFDGKRLLAIRHGAEVYTLRITRADKLILTK